MKPLVNKSKCNGCADCTNTCPIVLFEIKDGKSIVKKNAETECLGCKACEVNCPKKAITVKE